MTKKLLKVAHVPDAHTPWHDARAVKCVKNVFEAEAPFDELIFHGDFWEIYSLSFHSKSPDKEWQDLGAEIAPGREILDELVRAARPRRVVFHMGNHENRIKRFIAAYAPKLHKLVTAETLLQLPEKWLIYPYNNKGVHRITPRLITTHGSTCGVHHAAIMLKKYNQNVLYGHTHRIQWHSMTDFDGRVSHAISIGWIGDWEKVAEYIADVANWQQAFAITYSQQSSPYNFWIELFQIINGECLYRGKKII